MQKFHQNCNCELSSWGMKKKKTVLCCIYRRTIRKAIGQNHQLFCKTNNITLCKLGLEAESITLLSLAQTNMHIHINGGTKKTTRSQCSFPTSEVIKAVGNILLFQLEHIVDSVAGLFFRVFEHMVARSTQILS